MKKLPLHKYHADSGARFIDVRGWHIPADYGDVMQETETIHNTVALLDRSYLGKVLLKGPDAQDLLNRISTNDMMQLVMGIMCDTVFCTPKGRIVDYCRVLQYDDQLMLVSSYIDSANIIDWINRFIILEDIEVKDASADYLWLTVMGPEARPFVQSLSGTPVVAEDETIWIQYETIQFAALLNRNFIVPAYNFALPKTPGMEVFKWLTASLKQFDGMLIGDRAYQVLRVESGMPDWGTELTQDYNPHEARLLHAVSFTKGCYTGQEVIARLDTYDKVQKYLMIIDLEEEIFDAPPFKIFYDDEEIGLLTSYAFNPATQRSVGLAYIRKHFAVAEFNITIQVLVAGKFIPGRMRIPPVHDMG
ncbi:MAG TPA: aminomethyl transferase family protein [Caldithrix abyssi]|uniref:Aminomethyl transferase family protein n=1 Tax=Caldithrix abyssi TaxID=187145 RepID=A0A7V4TYT0_CALAY|nr:aminomethyl transferase family protein [Caldithrix abyssi]